MILAHVTVPLILLRLFNLDLLALLLGSAFPNFDSFPTLLRKKMPRNTINEFHARSILHAPFFFMLSFPVLYYFYGFVVAFSFSLGGLIHIISESFDEKGRPLLYPLRKKLYGIRMLPYDFWTYTTDKKVFALEASLFVIACFLLLA